MTNDAILPGKYPNILLSTTCTEQPITHTFIVEEAHKILEWQIPENLVEYNLHRASDHSGVHHSRISWNPGLADEDKSCFGDSAHSTPLLRLSSSKKRKEAWTGRYEEIVLSVTCAERSVNHTLVVHEAHKVPFPRRYQKASQHSLDQGLRHSHTCRPQSSRGTLSMQMP